MVGLILRRCLKSAFVKLLKIIGHLYKDKFLEIIIKTQILNGKWGGNNLHSLKILIKEKTIEKEENNYQSQKVRNVRHF